MNLLPCPSKLVRFLWVPMTRFQRSIVPQVGRSPATKRGNGPRLDVACSHIPRHVKPWNNLPLFSILAQRCPDSILQRNRNTSHGLVGHQLLLSYLNWERSGQKIYVSFEGTLQNRFSWRISYIIKSTLVLTRILSVPFASCKKTRKK